MHFVYLIKNKINDKIYIGKTSNPKNRWTKHLRIASGKRNKEKFYLHKAISKYGEDNFSFDIIESYIDQKECADSEIFYITYLKSLGAELYNLTGGGEGCAGRVLYEETKKKISESHKGLKHTEETKRKISKINNERFKDPTYKEKITRINQEMAKQRSGENNNFSKLNISDVIEIRNKYKSGTTYNQLALEYKVSNKNIGHIVRYKTWKNV